MSGVVLMVTAAVILPSNASNSIYGVLFPSTVTIHNGSETKVIDGTGDHGILNYNNKAYIPLRAFAEAMGSRVEYEPPADDTEVHKIDIFQGQAPIQWALERDDLSFAKVCSGFPFFIIPTKAGVDGNLSDRFFNVYVHNFMNDDVTVNPVSITFKVTDQSGNMVYSRELPPLSGVIPGSFGYYTTISWDHTDSEGNEVPHGFYYIRLDRPSEVTYKVLGTDEEKTEKIYSGMGCNLEYFGITI